MVHLSYLYMTTGKTIALTIWTFVGKVMSLVFNMLPGIIIAFLPRSKHLLISWLKSLSAVILKPKKILVENRRQSQDQGFAPFTSTQDNILKSRGITLLTKVHIVHIAMIFPVVIVWM